MLLRRHSFPTLRILRLLQDRRIPLTKRAREPTSSSRHGPVPAPAAATPLYPAVAVCIATVLIAPALKDLVPFSSANMLVYCRPLR